MSKELTNELAIQLYFHCAKCIDEKPDNISPRDYAKNEAGFTKEGIQVWCKRHDCNIVHIDFQGQQHPANTTS